MGTLVKGPTAKGARPAVARLVEGRKWADTVMELGLVAQTIISLIGNSDNYFHLYAMLFDVRVTLVESRSMLTFRAGP